jgi:hypothetical protein
VSIRPVQVPRLTFLLGLQRSGSTWLTNILDAHERAWVFMEPFAPDYGIFPEFPETAFFMDESSPGIEQLLRKRMPERLLRYKQLLTARSVRSKAWFRAERTVLRLMLRQRNLLPKSLWQRARKTELLNLNRMDDDAPIVDKASHPDTWVIKELRLAGKVPVLRQAYPDARFVVLIRHPLANVHAIAAWFERGRLRELRRDLDSFVAKMSAQAVGSRYAEQLRLCRNGTEAHRIALYWRVHNEALVDQLSGSNQALILTYEELAVSPASTVARMVDFCGLPGSASVQKYVEESSNSSVVAASPITTLRNSATHFRAWEAKISPAVREATLEVVQGTRLLPMFSRFYEAGA